MLSQQAPQDLAERTLPVLRAPSEMCQFWQKGAGADQILQELGAALQDPDNF